MVDKIRFKLHIFVLFQLCCSTPVNIHEQDNINLFYSSLSVCDCYKSAMSVLSNLIEYNDQIYKDLFLELRMNCLTKYGTQLFIPSYCNYPDSLQNLQDSLHYLGIDING